MLNKSNIVLEIIHITMKNVLALVIILALVVFTTFLWLSKDSLGVEEVTSLGVILAVVGFAVFILMRRIKSWKQGEPQEDESCFAPPHYPITFHCTSGCSCCGSKTESHLSRRN